MDEVQRFIWVKSCGTGRRLEESKVIMCNWLSHLKHLAENYPPVSLRIFLSGLPLKRRKVFRLWNAGFKNLSAGCLEPDERVETETAGAFRCAHFTTHFPLPVYWHSARKTRTRLWEASAAQLRKTFHELLYSSGKKSVGKKGGLIARHHQCVIGMFILPISF